MYSCTGPLEVSSLMSLPLVLALLFTLSSMQVDAGKRLQARMLIQNHNSSQPEGFVVEAHEDWAPHGYQRFKELLVDHYFDGARFFRAIELFVAQWGLPADPAIANKYEGIPDDEVVERNGKGFISFAATGLKDSRTTQLFINLRDNYHLDQSFPPVAKVVEGMDVVERMNFEYGDHPSQAYTRIQGESYLAKEFPRLTKIVKAEILREEEDDKVVGCW